jgi:hypothetical protein
MVIDTRTKSGLITGEALAWKEKADFIEYLALIPTLFKFNTECDSALLRMAAKLAVERKRMEIQEFLSYEGT